MVRVDAGRRGTVCRAAVRHSQEPGGSTEGAAAARACRACAVDLARYTIGHARPDELGFGEVIEPVNPLRVAVAHEEHGVRRIFRPRDQKEMVGAEVEHAGERKGRSRNSRRLGSAVVEFAGGRLQRVIITARRVIGAVRLAVGGVGQPVVEKIAQSRPLTQFGEQLEVVGLSRID